LSDVVEKPSVREAPSHLGIVGRYLMTPDLFDCIKQVSQITVGEVQLTDAIKLLLNERDVYAHVIEGMRYDTGDKTGYIKAFIDFALERDDLSHEIRQYLVDRVSTR